MNLDELKELYAKSKQNFSQEEDCQDCDEQQATEQFAMISTKDGELTLKVEGELKEGVEIFVVGEEEAVPAPDGTYELEDDRKVVVKDGMVDSFELDEEEEEEEEETTEGEYTEDEVEEDFSQVEETEEDVQEDVVEDVVEEEVEQTETEQLVELMSKLVLDMDALKQQVQDIQSVRGEVEKVKEQFSKFEETPAGTPTTPPAKSTKKTKESKFASATTKQDVANREALLDNLFKNR